MSMVDDPQRTTETDDPDAAFPDSLYGPDDAPNGYGGAGPLVLAQDDDDDEEDEDEDDDEEEDEGDEEEDEEDDDDEVDDGASGDAGGDGNVW